MENFFGSDSDLWARIAVAEFIQEAECYKACASFCCRWEHEDLNFSFIPKGGTLFYLPHEYVWMRQNAKVQESVKKLEFQFSDRHSISLYFSYCEDCAQCRRLFDRTLYCKLYPFLPLLSREGELEGLSLISPYDVAMEYTQTRSPCAVMKKKAFYFDKFRNDASLMALLRQPYVHFHLRAARHLSKAYQEALAKDASFCGLAPRNFWKRWEFSYLSGKLFPSESIRQAVAEDFACFCAKHPAFDSTFASFVQDCT
jgi:hypothetical protein